ncbi:MAG: methyltransferase domain-containing protein [Nitriliruptorales bacterium]|nr:methyltransferase domain-containing protein [Nitriliruptorales bacterium]
MNAQATLQAGDIEQVMGSLLTDIAATAGLQMIHIGIKTGLWQAMAGAGSLTPAEVAARADVAEPYAREWLNHQAASGYVDYDAATRTFELPPAVAAVLGDEAQARLVEGFASMLASMTVDNALVEEAFRSGMGVGWHQRSSAHWHGMDLATRAAVVPALVSAWIPALGEVEGRLRAGAKVADVGCGYGALLLALAEVYPESRFYGFDYHDASVAQARRSAAAADVADTVTFEVADATAIPGDGYDLILFVDSFHDLGDPVEALRRARQALSSDGRILLVEFAAGDTLEDNFNPLGRLLYASSALVCTPNALAQGATDPLGSAPGAARLTQVAHDAGFTRVRRVDVDAPMNLLLELRP